MAFSIPEFDYKGIKQITIPKRDADFVDAIAGLLAIKKHLPSILSTHRMNEQKITYLYEYYLGQQDIQKKSRLHDVDKDNNHQEVENHALRQVEFKVGFLCGEPRDYTHKNDTNSDDLLFLSRYFTDCQFYEKDAVLKEWIYATGIGVTETRPRTDIIETRYNEETNAVSARYLTAEDGFDIDFEAPFTFYCVDPRQNFVVYSSANGRQPLFCVTCVDIDMSDEKSRMPIAGKEYIIETRYHYYRFKSASSWNSFVLPEDAEIEVYSKSIRYLPLIEFSVNTNRMGVIEKNRSMFNTINLFRSATNDMLIDNSNAILLFKNVDIDAKQVREMREAGAIIISDSPQAGTNGNADMRTVTVQMELDKMVLYIDQIVQNAYDIAGVPLASGQVTSGGDTGQARLLGGGWNNAYVIINKEKLYIRAMDYEQLKLFLLLCKQVPNCKLNELFASQIEINYRINQSDNLLVKVEALKMLYEMNFPTEASLKITRLSNDIKTDGRDWEAKIQKALSLQAKMQAQEQASTEYIDLEQTDLKKPKS